MTSNTPKYRKIPSLIKFLRELSPDQRTTVAKRLNTSVAQLRNIAFGTRDANVRLAIGLDKESAGLVPMQELIEDLDYSYLLTICKRKLPPKEDSNAEKAGNPV